MQILRDMKRTLSAIAAPDSDLMRDLDAAIENFENMKKAHEEANERIAEQAQALDEKTDALDSLRQHAPSSREIPGENDDERIKNAIQRYDDLREVLRDYWTDEEVRDKFDTVVKALDEALEDYGEASNTLASELEIAEIKFGNLDGKLTEYLNEQAAKPGALDVVEAATELLRDLEWGRPNPYPLADLRDALRTYHGKDDMRAPSLPGVE